MATLQSHRDKVWWVIISDVSRIDLAERDVETLYTKFKAVKNTQTLI